MRIFKAQERPKYQCQSPIYVHRRGSAMQAKSSITKSERKKFAAQRQLRRTTSLAWGTNPLHARLAGLSGSSAKYGTQSHQGQAGFTTWKGGCHETIAPELSSERRVDTLRKKRHSLANQKADIPKNG